ncbi:MAG: hypothetical protein JRJ14_09545 [Deltaproteobacteria bacterium]|nr:hypothetical protein [Deltaproteobacteria bacterium]
MEGPVKEGFYTHPNSGVIKIFQKENGSWVYQCYTQSGQKAISREKSLDTWTWALCEPK